MHPCSKAPLSLRTQGLFAAQAAPRRGGIAGVVGASGLMHQKEAQVEVVLFCWYDKLQGAWAEAFEETEMSLF